MGAGAEYRGAARLATFSVLRAGLRSGLAEDPPVDVRVELILQRQVQPYLLGVFLPTLFIMIIAQV